MATLAEIRAKPQEQENPGGNRPSAAIMQFFPSEYAGRSKLLQLDFLTVTNPNTFFRKERLMTQTVPRSKRRH